MGPKRRCQNESRSVGASAARSGNGAPSAISLPDQILAFINAALWLADYDAKVFGSPTRFGSVTGQMRNFLDQAGGLGQMSIDEVMGGSPYGAATIAGGDGRRQPSVMELEAARFQGQHVATIAGRLAAAAGDAERQRAGHAAAAE